MNEKGDDKREALETMKECLPGVLEVFLLTAGKRNLKGEILTLQFELENVWITLCMGKYDKLGIVPLERGTIIVKKEVQSVASFAMIECTYIMFHIWLPCYTVSARLLCV